jgi:hypothetical protein
MHSVYFTTNLSKFALRAMAQWYIHLQHCNTHCMAFAPFAQSDAHCTLLCTEYALMDLVSMRGLLVLGAHLHSPACMACD